MEDRKNQRKHLKKTFDKLNKNHKPSKTKSKILINYIDNINKSNKFPDMLILIGYMLIFINCFLL